MCSPLMAPPFAATATTVAGNLLSGFGDSSINVKVEVLKDHVNRMVQG